jgi:hypothetical protein
MFALSCIITAARGQGLQQGLSMFFFSFLFLKAISRIGESHVAENTVPGRLPGSITSNIKTLIQVSIITRVEMLSTESFCRLSGVVFEGRV